MGMARVEAVSKLFAHLLRLSLNIMIAKDPAAQATFKKASFDETGMSATFIHENIAILANDAAAMLNAANADNYLQFDMVPRLDRGMRPIRVTVQWANGESPADQNARLRKEIEQLKEATQP